MLDTSFSILITFATIKYLLTGVAIFTSISSAYECTCDFETNFQSAQSRKYFLWQPNNRIESRAVWN